MTFKRLLMVVVAAVMMLTPATAAHYSIHTPGELSARERHFLESCSGVKVYSEYTYAIAYSLCLGKIQGIKDVHQTTIMMLSIDMNDSNIKQHLLWCSEGNKQHDLVDMLFEWVDTNPQTFDDINKRFRQHDASVAIIFKALMQLFPCPPAEK